MNERFLDLSNGLLSSFDGFECTRPSPVSLRQKEDGREEPPGHGGRGGSERATSVAAAYRRTSGGELSPTSDALAREHAPRRSGLAASGRSWVCFVMGEQPDRCRRRSQARIDPLKRHSGSSSVPSMPSGPGERTSTSPSAQRNLQRPPQASCRRPEASRRPSDSRSSTVGHEPSRRWATYIEAAARRVHASARVRSARLGHERHGEHDSSPAAVTASAPSATPQRSAQRRTGARIARCAFRRIDRGEGTALIDGRGRRPRCPARDPGPRR